MTAPTLKQYPNYSDRQRNFPKNVGLVASFTPGKGWQASGFGLSVPAELSASIGVEEVAA